MRTRGNMRTSLCMAVLAVAAWAGPAGAQTTQPASGKLGAPSPAALADAERLVKEVYKTEYLLKSPAERRQFALKLLQHGLATHDDAASRYVLLREAREVATSAGDCEIAFQAIDAMDRAFTFNARVVKLGVLSTVGKGPLTAESAQGVLSAGGALLDDLLAENDFDTALEVVPVLESAGRRALSGADLAAQQARLRDVRTQATEFTRLKPMRDKLATAPNDPEANLAVGRYLCLARGDWKAGLPLLAKGADAALKAQALADLAQPADAADQVKVGDGWQALADKELPGRSRTVLQARALGWYQAALPGATGLRKTALEMKVQKLTEALGPAARTSAIKGPVSVGPAVGGSSSQPATEAPFRPIPIPGANGPRDFALSADGRLIAWPWGSTVKVYELASGRNIKDFSMGRGDVRAPAFSPDGRRLAVVHHNKGVTDSHGFALLDLATGQTLARCDPPGQEGRRVSFTPDGRRAIGCATGRTSATPQQIKVSLWDVTANRLIGEVAFSDHPSPGCGTLSADGRKAYLFGRPADGGSGGQLVVVDTLTGTALSTVPVALGNMFTTALLPLPGDKQIVLGAMVDGREFGPITVEIETGAIVQKIGGATNWVSRMALSPDGRRVLGAGGDRTLRLWDLASGTQMLAIPEPTGIWDLAFTPDGRSAITLGREPDPLRIWTLPR